MSNWISDVVEDGQDWAGHMVYVLPENPATPYAGQSTVTPYKTFKNIPDPAGIFNTHRRYSPLGH